MAIVEKKRKVKVTRINGKISYCVNGKEYDNFDDIPDEYKYLIRDENQNNIPDFFEEKDKDENKLFSTNKKTSQEVNVRHYQKRYNIDELPPHIQEKIRKGELEDIAKELAELEKNKTKKTTNITEQSNEFDKNKKIVKQYCKNCGPVLTKKSFFGYLKCESCGKRIKKKDDFEF